MVAASLSSSSINRIAAAEDPSMAGFAGTGSRASGTGALLHQLAHDKRGALRILANEGPDQIGARLIARRGLRSEEHTSELQSIMRTSYAVSCLKKKTLDSHDK